MGIYSEYGIEYGGYNLDGKYITLLPLKVFDQRLKHSTYYIQRKKFYEDNYGSTWCVKIDTIDIELCEHERELIHKTDLKDHSFYDVSRVHDTL
jgi:hypothetical protein